MSAETGLAALSTVDGPVRGPRRTLTVLRTIAVLHSACALGQPVLAAVYLSGEVQAINWHQLNAAFVGGIGLVQVIAAIVFVWGGRGRAWPLYAALAVNLAEHIQAGLGYSGIVAIHIPLGVSIIASQLLLTVWLFREATRAGRPRKAGAR